ncbi:LacI family DNA-binding transcriptional regulator [Acholeplasma laidlawii]|jgi:LacI family transcriptional regulator|uniref:Transcriptional regulator, LacI family n=2 Tax=Acholeplasma laidlawii TaxID=2148 RepID=A9NG50_ACHLI|nr:LacI family DNA-binding transcriptional regulator [Acholeplasma laidlawii]ABX81330.1 transcriptional regulator, LacI family [Acholeplasma laidlawii PG-8A]NWH10090.1 LacI family DNA-binding transcriptional regulator [Acholeplasma laidlawii]NWH11480.1 LacI family DNA-binding transcriptional regulator [Acholeplasma laidlawii]NWH13110.1 LacI family DNA-binding transcriptional regulator [Acholeplasma laidlawii]NWH14622.1 LacI family DNA-binding transcriptional regulator [Acholeplasma laidlawii]
MVTIGEIARAAGVSISTVSKSLNGYKEISDQTRNRVKKIAEQMGYTPNAAAQSLVLKRANTIGIVYEVESGLKNLFFAAVLESFRKHIQSKGYDILLLSNNTESKLDYLKHSHSKNVDAVLVISTDESYEAVKKLFNSDLAVLSLDPKEAIHNTIYSDSYSAIRKSCNYLYELGHRKIAFINGSYQNFIGLERLRGYLDFMKEKGLEPLYLKNRSNESYTFHEGYQTMKALFEAYGLPDAVCTVSDLMAMGAIQFFNNHGYHVPKDVSIIGFDDLDICEITTPQLTTIRQDYEEIGLRASEALIEMLDKHIRMLEPIVIDTKIVVRDSCLKNTKY